MAVLLDELLAPIGELSADMFPDQSLTVAVGAWLEQATAAASSLEPAVIDRAIKHWVYGRAYRTIARRLALQPNSASAEEISESIGSDRIKYFDRLADMHETSFEDLRTVPPLAHPNTGTQSVVTRVKW